MRKVKGLVIEGQPMQGEQVGAEKQAIHKEESRGHNFPPVQLSRQ